MIEREGYRVVRFWNNEVLTNTDGVARILAGALQAGAKITPIQPALSGYAAKLRHPSPIKGEEAAAPFALNGGRIRRLGPFGPSRSWMRVSSAPS